MARIPSRSAAESPEGTSSPVSPARTISGISPAGKPTTGVPHASDSITINGPVSCRVGTTQRSAALNTIERSRSLETYPKGRHGIPICCTAACPPTTSRNKFGSSRRPVKASTNRENPLRRSLTLSAAKTSTLASCGMPRAFLANALSLGAKASTSTPYGITVTGNRPSRELCRTSSATQRHGATNCNCVVDIRPYALCLRCQTWRDKSFSSEEPSFGHEPHSSRYFLQPASKWHPPVNGFIS